MNRKTIQLLLVVAFVIAAIAYLEGTKVSPSLSPAAPLLSVVGMYPKAPELARINGYLNAEPGLKIADFRGKVVLIDFWTYTCINCIRTLPHLTAWDRKYRDKGLVIIGVHTPEFEFEKDYNNVKAAMEKYGIEYRVVQDNDYETWRAFRNRYWPHKHLIDANGFIRYDHIGEGAYDETEKKIQELLAEIGHGVSDMGLTGLEDRTPTTILTPELYAGFDYALPRGQNIGNEEGLQPGKTIDYSPPDRIRKNVLYLEGKWKSNPGNLESQDEESTSIVLDYTASAVNIVADVPEPLRLEVFIDGAYIARELAGDDVAFEDGKAFIVADQPRLYNVVKGKYGIHTLKLTTNAKGFMFNAFTFG